MRVIQDAWNASALASGTVATIGNYDGLHRGQRAIVERVVGRAAARGLTAAAVTFEPHPLAVLRPDAAPPRLTTPDQKRRLLEETGVELLAVIHFTAEFARTSAASFVEEFLGRRLGVRELLVGSRFAFGREREGDLALLGELGRALGIRVEGVEEVLDGGEPVSSTRIRRAVRSGQVEEAARLLGRPYAVVGRVERGEGRGKALGWPTVNLAPENELLPADGVYVSRALLRAGESLLGAVTNVGRRPTFDADDGDRVLESHLLDFGGDLYGEAVELQFLARIREERAFPSSDDLVAQIGRDAASAREYLEGIKRLELRRSGQGRSAVP